MTVNERGAGMRLTKYDFLHPCRHCGGESFRVVSVAGDEPDVAIVCERCNWTVPSRKIGPKEVGATWYTNDWANPPRRGGHDG